MSGMFYQKGCARLTREFRACEQSVFLTSVSLKRCVRRHGLIRGKTRCLSIHPEGVKSFVLRQYIVDIRMVHISTCIADAHPFTINGMG